MKEFFSKIQQRYKEILPIFIDVSKLTESIKFFSDAMIVEFVKSHEKDYLDQDLELFFHSFADGKLYEAYRNYQRQVEPTKIFDTLLKFLTLISNEIKLVIILDEFQDILEFTRIKGLKNLDSIFRSELQNQFNIFYVITGSYPSILRDLIQNPQRKLYSHFEIYDIKNFDKEASLQLINLFKKDLSHEQKIALYKSCNGNPYLISLILQKVDLNLLGDLGTNFKNLLFDRKGAIYVHYEYLLEESLLKIQNSIVLKALLKEISLSDTGLTLTELAKKI
jgi:AAA+ ATPase superfamily predicted ATPase